MRCVLALLALVGATLLKQEKERPVTKVINLLKDMQKQLKEEMETDQEVYDKLACWCETNDKEKTEAVDIAQKRITGLVSDIEELTGKSARLTTEIKTLGEEIEKNQEALNKATAIRTKELAEFNAEEKDMMQSIQALKNAVVVLGKHHEMPAESLAQVASIMKHHLSSKHLQGTISPTQKESITAFLQQPAGFQSYAPASGQIFGILKQMKETFESNLSQSQKDELAAQDAFSQLKSAKLAEIAAAKKQLDNKSVELANTDEANAQAKEDLADTRNALSADTKFLLDLKEKCRMTDNEFAERQKARGEEISAVSEAIAILSDDDAHDTFSKTLGFVQVKAVSAQEKARNKAVLLLKAAAQKSGNSQLLALAATAQLDAFTKVKEAIDEMVTALLKEKQDEIKHRDFCTEELAQNDKQTAISTDEKNDLEANIANLEANIDTLTQDLAALAAEIKEAQVQVKRASEDRELENKEFQQTVADQRATQQILKKALDRLKVVYGFVQTSPPEPGAAAPPPPPGFSDYKQNAGAGGVLTMIQSVINDAKTMEREAIMAEQDSQSAYESFVKNTNDEIAAAMKSTTAKTESKAKAEEALTQAKADLKATMSALEQLASYAADVHQSCDFVLKNFEIRQTARAQEMEALAQAKAVLSGADFA
jgi:outer membrane murein-binding lipoprotein Lpp